MKQITIEESANLIKQHKVTTVDIRKVFNDTYKNVWEIDVMLLGNGQAIGLEGDGGGVSYWLIEAADFKE
jgi:hypothetical protein